MSAFPAGQYLVWNLAGHATIRITVLGGSNPVVSGLLFGSEPQQKLAAGSSPQTVTVTLTLTAPAMLGVAPGTLNFAGITGGANPATQTLNILNNGASTLNWSASKTQSWLSLSQTSGSGPARLGRTT